MESYQLEREQTAMTNQGLQSTDEHQYEIVCPGLPLAVYREVEAHLRQVTGVEVDLIPQRSQQFDYLQSQIGGLRVRFTAQAEPLAEQRVEQILSYYGDRYGAWEAVNP